MAKPRRPAGGPANGTSTAAPNRVGGPGSVEPLRMSAATVGSTGLKHGAGFITEEFLTDLRGVRGARKFREMADNDFVCGAILFAVTSLIRGVEWTVQAADDSVEADAGKAFLEEVLTDMRSPWDTVITEICTMFQNGYSPMEITWKVRDDSVDDLGLPNSKFTDGKIGIKSIALRGQETVDQWDIDDEDGTVRGFWQTPFNRPRVYLPMSKCLLFRTEAVKNTPVGRSILRSAYRSWYFKTRIEEIEAIGVERDLAGLPLLTIPAQYMDSQASQQDKAVYAAYQRLVSNIRRDKQEGIILPSTRDKNNNPLFEFKLVSTGGARSFDTNKVLTRYDRAIATAVLADFIFLGQQAVGSFALSSDKTALFGSALEAFLKHSIAQEFNTNLVPRLWFLNGLDNATMPQLVPGDIEEAALADVTQFITAMASAGQPLFPDRELENVLRKRFGLPPAPEDGEDASTPPGPGQTDPGTGDGGDDAEEEEDAADADAG